MFRFFKASKARLEMRVGNVLLISFLHHFERGCRNSTASEKDPGDQGLSSPSSGEDVATGRRLERAPVDQGFPRPIPGASIPRPSPLQKKFLAFYLQANISSTFPAHIPSQLQTA